MEYKKQHFVPKAYLKAWRDPGSSQAAYVWTASSDGRGQLKRESPRRLFEGDDFYTVTDESGNRNLELEEKLHEVEDDFIKVRDEVIAKKKPLQVEDRKSIALFASTLYARPNFNVKSRSKYGRMR